MLLSQISRPIAYLLALLFSPSLFAQDEAPEMEISEIAANVYLHKSFQDVEPWGIVSSNGLVVIEDGGAFIVDTPWSESDTEKLVTWIREQGFYPLGSVSTHSHSDRTAGVSWMNRHSIPTHALDQTNNILNQEGEETTRYSFEGPRESLAQGLIEAFYPGRGHTKDNIVIWLPEQKILYGGCFVRSLSSQDLGYTGEAYVDEWAASVDRVILEFPELEIVVPGHGMIGDLSLLQQTKTLALFASTEL